MGVFRTNMALYETMVHRTFRGVIKLFTTPLQQLSAVRLTNL